MPVMEQVIAFSNTDVFPTRMLETEVAAGTTISNRY